MKKLPDNEKALVEFACAVCWKRTKQNNPEALGCAWLCLENDCCPEIFEALEEARQ